MSFDFIDRKFGRGQAAQAAKPCRDWWCDNCADMVDGGRVTFEEMHDACGCKVEPYCDTCESGGWVQIYSPHPPMFDECPDCYNPFNRPSP